MRGPMRQPTNRTSLVAADPVFSLQFSNLAHPQAPVGELPQQYECAVGAGSWQLWAAHTLVCMGVVGCNESGQQ